VHEANHEEVILAIKGDNIKNELSATPVMPVISSAFINLDDE
jgi:hypothetical protein